ncbi:MAG: hypothetical protein J6X81_02375 [Muribaculaceae bacterium]|nr:hypothetical protein [Muribaculaceae bacterium]
MKKILFLSLTCSMLMLSSCSSLNQFYGAATGASIGGMFGSAIGGIAGGPRGSNLGALTGMAIGGVIGAAATAPKTDDGNYRSSDYYGDYDYSNSRLNNDLSPYADIEISDIRFADSNSNDAIDAGEHTQLIFIIRNNGNQFAYNIAPVITVSGTKEIYLSPTAIVSELAPGRAVRYQAEVYATNKLKSGVADFSIAFSDGKQLYNVCSFSLTTRR